MDLNHRPSGPEPDALSAELQIRREQGDDTRCPRCRKGHCNEALVILVRIGIHVRKERQLLLQLSVCVFPKILSSRHGETGLEYLDTLPVWESGYRSFKSKRTLVKFIGFLCCGLFFVGK